MEGYHRIPQTSDFLLYLTRHKNRILMLKSRYRRITFFFARVIGGIILWDLIFPRIGLRGRSQRTRSEEVGPVRSHAHTLSPEPEANK